jgi:hypothetical protein
MVVARVRLFVQSCLLLAAVPLAGCDLPPAGSPSQPPRFRDMPQALDALAEAARAAGISGIHLEQDRSGEVVRLTLDGLRLVGDRRRACDELIAAFIASFVGPHGHFVVGERTVPLEAAGSAR